MAPQDTAVLHAADSVVCRLPNLRRLFYSALVLVIIFDVAAIVLFLIWLALVSCPPFAFLQTFLVHSVSFTSGRRCTAGSCDSLLHRCCYLHRQYHFPLPYSASLARNYREQSSRAASNFHRSIQTAACGCPGGNYRSNRYGKLTLCWHSRAIVRTK